MAVGSAEGEEDGAADGISVNFMGSLSLIILLFVRFLSCFANALSSLSSAKTIFHVRGLVRSALVVGRCVGILLIGGDVGSLVGLGVVGATVGSGVLSPSTHRTLFFSSEHTKLEQHFLRDDGPAPHSWALWSSLAHLSSSSWRDRRKWNAVAKLLDADADADVGHTRGNVAIAVPSLIDIGIPFCGMVWPNVWKEQRVLVYYARGTIDRILGVVAQPRVV